MLEFIFGVIVGGVVMGIVMGFILKSRKRGGGVTAQAVAQSTSSSVPAGDTVAEKAANLEKLKELIAHSSDKITNDMVQAYLGVSDATATRYLDDLEKQGLIKQVGAEGKYVYYLPRQD